jgi:hypothetical protein
VELPECQYSRGHPQYVQNVELVNVNAIVQDAVEKNGEMTTACAGCFCAGAGRLSMFILFYYYCFTNHPGTFSIQFLSPVGSI